MKRSEGPLLAESGPQNSRVSLNLTSALLPEADIRLILMKRSANDPKRPLRNRSEI